jgi:hypothetical protein
MSRKDYHYETRFSLDMINGVINGVMSSMGCQALKCDSSPKLDGLCQMSRPGTYFLFMTLSLIASRSS